MEQAGGTLGHMGLRTDLVHKLRPEMLLSGVLANSHRYPAEPLLATKGVGSLAPTTAADKERDRKIRESLSRKVLRASK